MSSVSGIGSSTVQNLYQFIQGLSGGAAASSTGASSPSSSSTASSNDPLQALGQALKGAGGHRHRHGGGGGGSAMKQIQDAVSTALQSAQSTNTSGDPNKIVEDAIAKVLQNDPSSPTAAQQGATTAADADGDRDGSTTSSSTPATTGQTFNQLLQSFGISPDQFRQDFLSAVKDAQNGAANPAATAFQSVPLGSTLDTLA
jgi:hypothetical protein